MNIILTGVPGVGKTTLIGKVVKDLGNRCGGIVTREIREGGTRTGFAIESLDGWHGVLASKHLREGPRVGPYRVDVAGLEEIGIDSLRRALDEGKAIVIDEIGKMELISHPFRAIIIEALDSLLPVVATMGVSKNAFMEAVRKRPDVELIRITTENRNALAGRIVEMVDKALSGDEMEG